MPATTMQVQLLTMTTDAEALIYAACKQCTSQDGAVQHFYAMATDYVDDESRAKMGKLIRHVLDSGHDSVGEHVSFSFAISGVSRALSHQLVRHRIASYSQQSQRYVKADDFDYVVPPSIGQCDHKASVEYGNDIYFSRDAENAFNHAMECARAVYERLVKLGIPAEDARFVLPNACATKLVVTMNCRALLHFFEERLCKRAQWEISALAKAMYDICLERLPVVFAGRGPKCKRLGFCAEHKSCGMMPKRGADNV